MKIRLNPFTFNENVLDPYQLSEIVQLRYLYKEEAKVHFIKDNDPFVNIPYLCCPKGLKWTLVKVTDLDYPFSK